MASLQTLPAPLPLQILLQVHDLKGLDAARRSCSVFAAVFDKHAVELLEHVMTSSLHEDVAVVVRLYIQLIDAGKSSIQQSDVLDKILSGDSSNTLPRTIAYDSISYVLREVSYLASVCDEFLQSKLLKLQDLPHQHIKDKSFRWPEDNVVPDPYPEGITYKLPTPSPPNWVEQQRVLHALLMLQVERRLPAKVLSGLHHPAHTQDIIDEVTATMKSLGYTLEHLNHGCPDSWSALAPMPKSRVVSSPRDVAWENTLEHASARAFRPSSGYSFCKGAGRQWPHSPLKGVDWTVFRRLGFAFWDIDRMSKELEMEPLPQRVRGVEQNMLQSWSARAVFVRRHLLHLENTL